jgi:hypothetical protein
MFHTLIRYVEILKKTNKYTWIYMNVILLQNNHRNVLTTHVAMLRVVRKRVQVQIVCFFKCGVVLTYSNCICIIVLITPMTAT